MRRGAAGGETTAGDWLTMEMTEEAAAAVDDEAGGAGEMRVGAGDSMVLASTGVADDTTVAGCLLMVTVAGRTTCVATGDGVTRVERAGRTCTVGWGWMLTCMSHMIDFSTVNEVSTKLLQRLFLADFNLSLCALSRKIKFTKICLGQFYKNVRFQNALDI